MIWIFGQRRDGIAKKSANLKMTLPNPDVTEYPGAKDITLLFETLQMKLCQLKTFFMLTLRASSHLLPTDVKSTMLSSFASHRSF